jgi:riboflavin kinase/FMN adenylyltransferase
MCNLGVRPTFEEGEFVMEVHFLDPGIENFYGRNFLIEFLERIRDEKKFNTQNELIEQLRHDEEICRELQRKYS